MWHPLSSPRKNERRLERRPRLLWMRPTLASTVCACVRVGSERATFAGVTSTSWKNSASRTTVRCVCVCALGALRFVLWDKNDDDKILATRTTTTAGEYYCAREERQVGSNLLTTVVPMRKVKIANSFYRSNLRSPFQYLNIFLTYSASQSLLVV